FFPSLNGILGERFLCPPQAQLLLLLLFQPPCPKGAHQSFLIDRPIWPNADFNIFLRYPSLRSGVDEGGFVGMAVLQDGEALIVDVIEDDGFKAVEDDIVPPVEAFGESKDVVRFG